MREPSGKNMSASVRARLLNLVKAAGEDFQAIALRYTVERFLARLTRSSHRDDFVLKGAMLYIAWRLDNQRTTLDLDLLSFGNPDPNHLTEVIRSICSVVTEDDGLIFERSKVTASPIREDSIYDGVRVVVPVHLGVMPKSMWALVTLLFPHQDRSSSRRCWSSMGPPLRPILQKRLSPRNSTPWCYSAWPTVV